MNTVDVSLWTNVLGNFGFPVAITIYLFYRFERKIEKLEATVLEMNEDLKDLF